MTEIAAALANALIEDPFYRAVTIDFADDPRKRLRVLEHYCDLALQEGRIIGEVQHADNSGAAIWHTHEVANDIVTRQREIRSAGMQQQLGPNGFANYHAIIATMEQHLPTHLHKAWYLSILGVDPQARGQGIGRQLLERSLARADRMGVDTFLETFNPLSLAFYARLGFRPAAELHEPVTGSVYWLLIRKAGKTA